MAYLKTMEDGPGRPPLSCNACKRPIADEQQATRVDFQTDPDGARGLSGMYHTACSKVFQSLARVVNMNPWG